jgi:hypothetical protein
MRKTRMIFMRWIDNNRQMTETLLDLIVGCLAYSILFELIGLLVVQNKLAWTLGILLGTAAAVGMSISMYRGILSCLAMEPAAARRSMTIYSVLRLLLMLGVAWIGMRCDLFSFPAVIVGILGLKVSGHLHVYTHIYITKNLFKEKKGR